MPSTQSPRSGHSRRSRQELLALRKEIVLTRIAVERAELSQSTRRIRENLHGFRWVKLLVPGLSGSNGVLKLSGLLQRYPYISSLLSLALTGLSRTTPMGRLLRPAMKWGGLGMLAWQGFQLWQRAKAPNAETPASESAQVRRARRAAEADARGMENARKDPAPSAVSPNEPADAQTRPPT